MTEIIAKQQLHLVTGKGGVGKSTVAAGLAFWFAKQGKKTLLVELGERSFYSYALGAQLAFQPTKIEANLWASQWEPEECLKEYLGHLLKMQSLADLFFENRVMKALVNSAPALKELAISGKLTSGPRKVGPSLDFEHVVLDAYSTGHFKALLNASVGMSEAVGFGPMGDQSRGITEVMKNKSITKVYAVCLPEELPVKETLELNQFLQTEFGQAPTVVMNKSLNKRLPDGGLKELSDQVGDHVYLGYLLNQSNEERTSLKSLGDGVLSLKHQYCPASRDLYSRVSDELGGQLES